MKALLVQLEEEQHEALREKAFKENISMNEIVRRAIELYFKKEATT